MTTDYSIKYLEDLRKCRNDLGIKWDMVAAIDAGIAALREKAARDNPKPLTLDELWARENKPIYIKYLEESDSEDGWDILIGINPSRAQFTEMEEEFISAYGIDWIAYDYPPKAVHDANT